MQWKFWCWEFPLNTRPILNEFRYFLIGNALKLLVLLFIEVHLFSKTFFGLYFLYLYSRIDAWLSQMWFQRTLKVTCLMRSNQMHKKYMILQPVWEFLNGRIILNRSFFNFEQRCHIFKKYEIKKTFIQHMFLSNWYEIKFIPKLLFSL